MRRPNLSFHRSITARRQPGRPPAWRAGAVIAAIAAASLPATAHEYWIEKDGARHTLHRGHLSPAHAGDTHIAYDAATVIGADCLDTAGRATRLLPRGNPARVTANCAALRFVIDGGYWTKTPYDTVPQPRTAVPGAIESWRSEETVTRVDRWTPAIASAAATTPTPGLTLDLTRAPDTLRPGDKFTILARLDGHPRAGVAVAYDGETRGVTDADGRINLRVRRNGMQQISASVDLPLADGRADRLIRAATLNFLLP